LAPESPALQDAVSQLCCAVWLAKLEGRECIVAQTLPHLVIRALTTGAIICHMQCTTVFSTASARQCSAFVQPVSAAQHKIIFSMLSHFWQKLS
jgi:hypothetical protein